MLSSRPLTLAVLGIALLAGGCDRQSAPDAQGDGATSAPSGTEAAPGTIDRSHKGSQMPDFTLSDAKGGKIAFASLRGQPVLINLWATWCAPCIAELPALDKLAAARAGKLKVLTISEDMGDAAAVAAFLSSRGLTRLEPWLDGDGEVAAHYAANTLPTSIYYDAEGRELWRFAGARDWARAETAGLLDGR